MTAEFSSRPAHGITWMSGLPHRSQLSRGAVREKAESSLASAPLAEGGHGDSASLQNCGAWEMGIPR